MDFRIVKPAAARRVGLEPGRGETLEFVKNDRVDVHMNVLTPKGPRGRVHRHSVSDNVYIVKAGEGQLTVGDAVHTIAADDVVFIPAGVEHSLSNVSDHELVIYEIYAPAGPSFDFIARDPE